MSPVEHESRNAGCGANAWRPTSNVARTHELQTNVRRRGLSTGWKGHVEACQALDVVVALTIGNRTVINCNGNDAFPQVTARWRGGAVLEGQGSRKIG